MRLHRRIARVYWEIMLVCGTRDGGIEFIAELMG